MKTFAKTSEATMKTFNHIAVAALTLAALGCSPPPVLDKTQPNYTRKSDLLSGQWYLQTTIVDVPETSPVATVGYSDGLDKVRFEVQEGLLVAFRTYERLPGLDPRVDRAKSKIGKVVYKDGTPYKGDPVAAYRIQSHFDRQRQYNSVTGEQSNILVEDQQDRPWYQREFMRVDWSKNVIENYNAYAGQFGPIQSYVTSIDQNPEDDAWVEERSVPNDPKSELKYFDFTVRALMDPPMVYYDGYGYLPYCYINPTVDCESGMVKLRTSVKKVDEERVADYEPLVYDNKIQTKFGFFRNEQLAYDQGYGYTESGFMPFAMRHNIWKKARNADGTPMAVSKRDPRPIVYYTTANMPKELRPAALALEGSWDHAFRRAVAVPRGLEVSAIPQMFYVCESPVQAGAPAACGPEGTYVRMGDLRYNLIPYVEQITGGLLGLGPSSMDPETGEIVQAVANVYGPGLDSWSASSQQVMDVLNGDISLEKLVTGEDMTGYVFANLSATDPRRADGPAPSKSPLSADPTRPLSSYASLNGVLKTRMDEFKMKGHLPLRTQDRRAVAAKILEQNPSLESELYNLPEIRNAVLGLVANRDFQSRLKTDSTFFRKVARDLLMGNDPISRFKDKKLKAVDPKIGCHYSYEYSDDDYIGTAKAKLAVLTAAKAKYVSQGKSPAEADTLARKDVWDDLRRDAWRSIAEHEVGHTLGLMHNFIGSFDALNYKDGYWDLRKDSIGVTIGGKRVLPISPQNLYDAAQKTQKQIDNGMYEYEYSSIMDYGARVLSQNKGIGKYDEAAILFAYSGGGEPGWVEVFNQTRTDYNEPNVAVASDNMTKSMVVRGAHTEIPLAQVEHYTPVSTFYSDRFHYTTLPFHFADKELIASDFQAALDQGVQRMGNRSFRKWSEMQPVYDRIAAELKKYNLDLGNWSEPDWTRARDIIRKVGPVPVEVPYMFCSDYEVGANVACNRNDQGADVFEMTSKWMERFENTYVFSNFRRGRIALNPVTVFQGKFGRYLGNVPNVYQQWLFNIYWYQNAYEISTEQMEEYFGVGDPIWQNYFTMAVTDSTNLLMQQLATPSAGYHGKLPAGNWVYLGENNARNTRLPASAEATFKTQMLGKGYTDISYVPRGPGRPMYTTYDVKGYDWFGNFTRADEVGHFWDQIGALQAITTSETNFLGVDRGADALRYSLPYYITFNKELAPLFGNIWTENRGGYAGGLIKNADGTANVKPATYLKAEDYIAGFVYPPAPIIPTAGGPIPQEKVEAVPSWSTRFFSEVWGMMYFTENFNQEFASFNQIYRLGSGEALTPADNHTVVSFSDPFGGGYVYAAMKRNGVTDPAANVQMIELAALQKSKWDTAKTNNMPVDGLTAAEWEGKLRESVRNLEMMRGLYDIFSQVW
jgi:Met-zincin